MLALIPPLYLHWSPRRLTMWHLFFNTFLFVFYALATLGILSSLNPHRIFPLLCFGSSGPTPSASKLPLVIFRVPCQMLLLIQNFPDPSVSHSSFFSLISRAIFYFSFDRPIPVFMIVISAFALSYLPSKSQLREKV